MVKKLKKIFEKIFKKKFNDKDFKKLKIDDIKSWDSMTNLDLIFEIAGKKTNVNFKEAQSAGYHYTMTPYRYTPQQSEKLVPKAFGDTQR